MIREDQINELYNIYSESFKLAYIGFSYKELRELHKNFNSQIDANAIYDARKLKKLVLKTHNYPKKINPIPFFRKQDFRIKDNKVSLIYKPRERLTLNIFPSVKQLELMNDANCKGARLINGNGKYFLNLSLEKEVEIERWENCKTIIGVDIGINNIAVCSALLKEGRFTNPLFFKGGEWKHICDRKRKVRRTSKFNHLTNMQHEILHTVSKRIVEYAKQYPKPIIVLEKLGYFKNNSKNKRWNFLLGNWARRKLQEMIEYKAKWDGIPVFYINPAYTSLYCHYCGSKGNRDGISFKCPNCGREYNADANAAMNLAKRFRQLFDEPKAVIGECSIGDLSSPVEGKTYLPCQTHMQQNGSQMKRMKVTRTLRLPLAVGGG